MKITFAIPTNRGVDPQTLESAMNLVAENRQYEWHIICPSEGYTIAENRNYIATKAVNNKSDWLLMIDDDMLFSPDLLTRLIANRKDICGVAYHPRSETGQIVKFLDETHAIKLEDPEIKANPKYQTTFECHATGTGIILIKTEIFLKIPRPWFAFEYHETGQCKLGEDWYFCREAKKAGFSVWCDPTLWVGHIGEKVF